MTGPEEGESNGPIQFESARKICLCSNCSQKLDKCSLARARKIFPNSLPCSVSIICMLKAKTGTENNVSRMNWEHWGNIRAP